MSKLSAIIRSYVGVFVFACIIFIAGGKIRYWQAMLYLFVALLGTTLNHLLLPSGSNLTSERANKASEGVAWDRALLGTYFIISMISFVVAGLDSGRFGWTQTWPLAITFIGVLLLISGQVIFALAKRANLFFFSTVRIETTTSHAVCDTGLYTFVRHPGYVGMIISVIGFPLIMNSIWSCIPVMGLVCILLMRTKLEDDFLKEHLRGYREYARAVKWRVLPGIF